MVFPSIPGMHPCTIDLFTGWIGTSLFDAFRAGAYDNTRSSDLTVGSVFVVFRDWLEDE